jgi:hypothetical protein
MVNATKTLPDAATTTQRPDCDAVLVARLDAHK